MDLGRTKWLRIVENIAVLVNRTPQPAFPAIDANRDRVEMPNIVLRRNLAAYAAGIIRAVIAAPPADGFIGDNNAAFHRDPVVATDAASRSK